MATVDPNAARIRGKSNPQIADPAPSSIGGPGGQVWSYTDYPAGKFKARADQIKTLIPTDPKKAVAIADELLASGAPRPDIILNRKAVALQRDGDVEGSLPVLEQASAHCAQEGLPSKQTEYNLAGAHAKLATALDGRDDYGAEQLRDRHDEQALSLLSGLAWDFEFGAAAAKDKDFGRYSIIPSRPTVDSSGCCSETLPSVTLRAD